MTYKMKGIHFLACTAFVILFCGAFFVAPVVSDAKQTIVAVEGANFNVGVSMGKNLKSFVGKRVSLTLVSGKNFDGIVKQVGKHLVHLEKISGKEYFDALIRIDNISAIDARFRRTQR